MIKFYMVGILGSNFNLCFLFISLYVQPSSISLPRTKDLFRGKEKELIRNVEYFFIVREPDGCYVAFEFDSLWWFEKTEVVKQSGTAVPCIILKILKLVGRPETDCWTSRLFFVSDLALLDKFPCSSRRSKTSVIEPANCHSDDVRIFGLIRTMFLTGCSPFCIFARKNNLAFDKVQKIDDFLPHISNGLVFMKTVKNLQWRWTAKDIFASPLQSSENIFRFS